MALKNPGDMKNYKIITAINTLLSHIPFIIFLFVILYNISKLIKQEKIIEIRILVTLNDNVENLSVTQVMIDTSYNLYCFK